MGLDFTRYQELTHRTINLDLQPREVLDMCALGLAGEAGEVVEHIKKFLYHGHPLRAEKVLDELGDMLWYIAEMTTALKSHMQFVAEGNIAKLQERYPDKFSSTDSLNRQR